MRMCDGTGSLCRVAVVMRGWWPERVFLYICVRGMIYPPDLVGVQPDSARSIWTDILVFVVDRTWQIL